VPVGSGEACAACAPAATWSRGGPHATNNTTVAAIKSLVMNPPFSHAEQPRRQLLPLVTQVTKYRGTADGTEAVSSEIRRSAET